MHCEGLGGSDAWCRWRNHTACSHRCYPLRVTSISPKLDSTQEGNQRQRHDQGAKSGLRFAASDTTLMMVPGRALKY
jgi:hypothetical protein